MTSLPALRSDGAAAVPVEPAGKEQVELYLRTYGTLLRSSGDLRLRTLEQTHVGMRSSLHGGAGDPAPDLGAFIYATQRLPPCMPGVRHVIMGQSREGFLSALGEDVTGWQQVKAAGRRRGWYHDGAERLAVFLASQSDVDDLLPTLVAWQIEWNKLHRVLHGGTLSGASDHCRTPWLVLGGAEDDWRRLRAIWGDGFADLLEGIAAADLNLTVRMLGGTNVGYARATARWWQPIAETITAQGLDGRPVYFVSSNTHSLVNLVSGVAERHQRAIIEYVEKGTNQALRDELDKLRSGASRGNWHNFLYYAARDFFNDDTMPECQAVRRREENDRGIYHVAPRGAIEVAGQVIALDRLHAGELDPRLGPVAPAALAACRAVVVNVDYPLGMAAYNIMRRVMERTDELRGVYILGKAATLNAGVGDVMIPDVIHDEHSMNTYWLDNCFNFEDVGPYLVFGSALDHQRAVTVKGTFLQNRGYLDFYYRESYTVVEMEAGPYLDALYEGARADRYPMGENINFAKPPFDCGIIHYASDTPYTQARTLGARSLDYRGMDATYAAAVAILRRIFQREGIAASA